MSLTNLLATILLKKSPPTHCKLSSILLFLFSRVGITWHCLIAVCFCCSNNFDATAVNNLVAISSNTFHTCLSQLKDDQSTEDCTTSTCELSLLDSSLHEYAIDGSLCVARRASKRAVASLPYSCDPTTQNATLWYVILIKISGRVVVRTNFFFFYIFIFSSAPGSALISIAMSLTSTAQSNMCAICPMKFYAPGGKSSKCLQCPNNSLCPRNVVDSWWVFTSALYFNLLF